MNGRNEWNGKTGITSKNGSQSQGTHLIKRYIYFSIIFGRVSNPHMAWGILTVSESFLI
jgi:hypothetical protein